MGESDEGADERQSVYVEIPSFDHALGFEEQFGRFRNGVANDVIGGVICPLCGDIRGIYKRETATRHSSVMRFWYCPKCKNIEEIGQFLHMSSDHFKSSVRDVYADTIVKLLIETGRYKPKPSAKDKPKTRFEDLELV